MSVIGAVFDTNVIASGLVGLVRGESTPGELLRRWRAGRFDLITSRHILSERDRTLAKPYFDRAVRGSVATEALRAMRNETQVVELTYTVRGVASHPEDDLILATAVSAGAGFLVTGDGPLLALGVYEGVRILSPRAFLDLLAARQYPVT